MEFQKNIFLFAFTINKFKEKEEREKGGCNSFDHRDWKILTLLLFFFDSYYTSNNIRTKFNEHDCHLINKLYRDIIL